MYVSMLMLRYVCVYVYASMYDVCVCVYAYCVCMFTHVCKYVSIDICMCVYVLHVYACMCIYLCMRECMPGCACLDVYASPNNFCTALIFATSQTISLPHSK